mgnify:CR=1 FL=1|uniref:Methionine aminopeptidase n=1 Tax=Candidatus Methanomethylicus mesodigestus TaxID=1867258 RepID=A0A7C3EVG2_9CREN
MLTDEEVEKLLAAGRVVREVRSIAPRLVFPGARVIEICEGIEDEIRRRGAKPAFPCNVSVDSVGAHYTAAPGDRMRVSDGSLVKVDIGAHVDGYIADSAVTVSLGSEHGGAIKVAEAALENAIKAVRVGGRISDVGVVVERTIKSMGYKPIRNLTGHQIAPYTIHAGVSIPNVSGTDLFSGRFEPWSVYAIEPFVTLPEAAGEVVEGPPGNILHLAKLKRPKDPAMRDFFEGAYANFRTLPFARRWAIKIGDGEVLRRMVEGRAIYEYPTLVEASGRPIAQAEHTVLITGDGVITTT